MSSNSAWLMSGCSLGQFLEYFHQMIVPITPNIEIKKNVDNAISTQPWCIDINSGVESSIGIKDITLVKKILEKF